MVADNLDCLRLLAAGVPATYQKERRLPTRDLQRDREDFMPGDHDPYAALRFADYRRYLAGAVLASIGGEVLALPVGWEIYQRTGSAALLGFTGLAQFLPVLLLALPAGQAADRHSRKMLIVAAQLTMAVAALGLAAISWLQAPVPLIFACLVLAGCSRAFSMSSRVALLTQIVPAHHVANAVTWNSSGWQVATVGGPALGGLVLIWADVAIAYLATALCCLACVVLLIPIRPHPVDRPAETRSLASLLAGVRFVWRTELLLAAITLDLFAVLLGGATALLPIYATDILDIGSFGLGCLRAAPAVGALLMAAILAHLPPLRRAGPALLGAVAGYGLATIVFGLSHNPILSFAMLALAGALDNISVVVRGTLVQLLTPDSMRGRVSAVNAVFISSSNQLGEFESGITAQWFGPVASVVVGGIGTILVVLCVMLRWPLLRRLGPLHPATVLPPELSGAEASEESPLAAP
jgi:MFS family permease